MIWQLLNVYKTWDIQIFQLFCQVNKTYNPTINVMSYSKEHMEDGSNEPKHGINHWGQATSLTKKNYITILYPRNKFITNFK